MFFIKEFPRMRQPHQTRYSGAWWLLLWSSHFKVNISTKMKKNKLFCWPPPWNKSKTNLLFQTSFIFCSWKPTQHKPEAAKRIVIFFIKGKWTRFVNRYRIKDCLVFTSQQGFPSNSILESLLRNTSPTDSVTSQQVSTSLEENRSSCAMKPWVQKREE